MTGVGDRGRLTGNIGYTPLEDLYGPAGRDWAGEIGFAVREYLTGGDRKTSYGIGIDDMVIEWQESHPIAPIADACAMTNSYLTQNGQCAQIVLGSILSGDGGDKAIAVSVIDPMPGTYSSLDGTGGNLGQCVASDGLAGVQIIASSLTDQTGETYCLRRVSPGSSEFAGTVKITSRVNKPGDGYVYVGYSGQQQPKVSVRYLDRDDGVAAHLFGRGPDNAPGIANFDDDGDGTVDNVGELCSARTWFPGKGSRMAGTPARFSDDTCGCPDNPVAATISLTYDTVDLIVADAVVHDGDSTSNGGDNDGYPDQGETIELDVLVRNMANYAIENVELTLSTASPLIDCPIVDHVTIPRIEAHGQTGDSVNTSTLSTHFKFKVHTGGTTRTTTGQDFSSQWLVTVRAMAKAGPDPVHGAPVLVDFPISGTTIPQTFTLQHNLSKGTQTRAVDFFDDFELYANDADAVCTPAAGQTRCTVGTTTGCSTSSTGPMCYVKRTTGDDAAELKGTRCQVNNPDNPYGNNTAVADYCELGEGFSNSENHWHLHGPKPSSGTTCESSAGCPNPRSHTTVGTGTHQKSLGSSQYVRESVPDGNGMTSTFGRMYWVKTNTALHLGVDQDLHGTTPTKCNTAPCAAQAPVLEYWTQISLPDWRLLGGDTPWAFDAALTYICVDRNGNNDCDTKEDGLKDGTEVWEPLHAYFSPESTSRLSNIINCMYDPSDDGNTDLDFYDGSVINGPSSTCAPQLVDSCVGSTASDGEGLGHIWLDQTCWPEYGNSAEGQGGQTGTGIWIKRLYNLKKYRGQPILLRWHVSPGGRIGAKGSCYDFMNDCSNRDDGWFIDDVRVYGRATANPLNVDNTVHSTSFTCPASVVSSVTPRLAALPYPRNDAYRKPRPAIGCTNQTATYCDFNHDGTADVTSGTRVVTTDGPGRVVGLDASQTTAGACLGGVLEFQFTIPGQPQPVRDWLPDPIVDVAPTVATQFNVNVRCSSDTSQTVFTDYLNVGPRTTMRLSVSSTPVKALRPATLLSWQGPGTFDVASGDLLALGRASGDFSLAVPLVCATPETELTDSRPAPAPGSGVFYLVRQEPIGTWNDGTESNDRDRTLRVCETP